MTEQGRGTWHYGLVARWWDEFNVADPAELARFSAAIEEFGQPALDLGCGTGRILLPLLEAGFEVDGTDVSADMIALATDRARRDGRAPRLAVQALHELDLPRRYRTAFMCGVFGIGASRGQDREALRRVRAHLEPGGALLIDHELPYAGMDAERWARWLPGGRAGIPRAWPAEGDRRRTADGDEIELVSRLGAFDPLEQRAVLEMRARLWHDGAVAAEEEGRLTEKQYFAQEVLLLLDEAGFADVTVEGGHTGRPATADDGTVVFVART